VLREQGESEGSEALVLRCLALCEEIGSRIPETDAHLALGALRIAAGDCEGGRRSIAAARDMAREIRAPGVEVLARSQLALLPGGDAADALAASAELGERLDARERAEAALLLWKATHDPVHIEAAKRLLDESIAQADEETRGLMLTQLRVNREIVAASKAVGIA
jgi:hypothetical protein